MGHTRFARTIMYYPIVYRHCVSCVLLERFLGVSEGMPEGLRYRHASTY